MRKVIYKGGGLQVLRLREEKFGRSINLEKVILPKTVCILAFPNRRLLLERQYRSVMDRYIYEIPGGRVREGESPKHAALRELEEETGYSAKDARLLFQGYTSPGMTTELKRCYLATGLMKGTQHRDKAEIMTLKEVELAEALRMIRKGEIRDYTTIAAVLFYAKWLKD